MAQANGKTGASAARRVDAQGALAGTVRVTGPSSATPPRFSHRLRRRRSVWTTSLNLTPMIDVVFNLLFFFLLVSRFGPQEGMLPARLPAQKGAVAVDVPRTPLRIRLQVDPQTPTHCQASIDLPHEAPMAFGELAGRLRRIRQEVPGFDADTPIHLVAGDKVAWDHVVNAYNAALVAEYQKIFFAGSP